MEMALISVQNAGIGFGGPKLLDDVSLQIESGERICLIGRNGEGKSTLLRLLAGAEKPDTGAILVQGGVRVGFLPQRVPRDMPGTVLDIVLRGLTGPLEDWDAAQRARKVISQMGLNPDGLFAALSGGQKHRTLLAQALIHEPNVLLLDEPTNHLDIGSIQWLESYLLRYRGSVLFVTHDRAFLRKLATRIIELDRGRLTSWAYGYDQYRLLRQTMLEAEEKQNALFDKKLAQEETWIRQGVKARRTRNEGRVRALKALREERSRRREVSGNVSMQIQEARSSGQKVIAVRQASYAWGAVPVFQGLTTTVMRGEKIGIIGPNGCGKTTLLKVLLGRLAPEAGTVTLGTNIEIAYFDQHREVLDENKTVAENVGGEADFVTIEGRRRHVIGYLEDFLFPPERSRTPVRVLSGGERNRLLLARLFARPSNLLVLDEPTNDLDAETLELLEDLLVEYAGTVLLVSHDREFLNNVVSSTLVFEGEGRVAEYVGGYDDWLRQRPPKPEPAAREPEPPKSRPRKLKYNERQELELLPARIEALEKEIGELHQAMALPDFYKKSTDELRRLASREDELSGELEAAFARWAELETLAKSAS